MNHTHNPAIRTRDRRAIPLDTGNARDGPRTGSSALTWVEMKVLLRAPSLRPLCSQVWIGVEAIADGGARSGDRAVRETLLAAGVSLGRFGSATSQCHLFTPFRQVAQGRTRLAEQRTDRGDEEAPSQAARSPVVGRRRIAMP